MADDNELALVGMPEPPAGCRLPVPDVRQWRAVRLNLELAASILAPDTDALAEHLPNLVAADNMRQARLTASPLPPTRW